MKRKNGFTLAEVLITLSIIGVVAAMTLPTLNSNIGSARNRAALKKALSTLNGAVKMNEAQNGWNFANVGGGGNDVCMSEDADSLTAEDSTSLCALLNDAFVGETFLGNVAAGNPTNLVWAIPDVRGIGGIVAGYYLNYRLSDGAVVGLSWISICNNENFLTSARGLTGCTGYIDTNGVQGPNSVVQCETPANTKFIWNNDYAECEVQRNTNADIFPITFYDSIVELSTNAGRAYFNAR